MKVCPACQRQYDDETMKFCLDDGTALFSQPGATIPSTNAAPTWQFSDQTTEAPPTLVLPANPQPRTPRETSPPDANVSVVSDRPRSNAMLWIALALILGGSAIVVAFLLTRGRQPEGDSASVVANPSPSQNPVTTATPAADSSAPLTDMQMSSSNRETQKSTPLSRATPNAKEAVAKTEVKEEPPPPPPSPPREPLSGGVLNGKAVRLVQPAYPAIARSAHASGQVRVQIIIDENGNVISASPVSGHPLLQGAAVSAARASKFTPTRLSGQPVKVSGVIIYNFVAQ